MNVNVSRKLTCILVHQNFVAPKCFFLFYLVESNAAFTFSTSKFYQTKLNYHHASTYFSELLLMMNFTDRKDTKQRYVKPSHLILILFNISCQICNLITLRSCFFETLCHSLECQNNSSFVGNMLVWLPKMVLIKSLLVGQL